MKLYTEEQLLNTIKSFQYYLEHYDKGVFPSVMEKHLKALAPIELPSDEEVERRIKDLEKRLYDCSKSNAW